MRGDIRGHLADKEDLKGLLRNKEQEKEECIKHKDTQIKEIQTDMKE